MIRTHEFMAGKTTLEKLFLAGNRMRHYLTVRETILYLGRNY